MLLHKICTVKEQEIAQLKKRFNNPVHTQTCMDKKSTEKENARPSFVDSLHHNSVCIGNKKLSIITEYKRASPSQGVICDSLDVEEVVLQYAQNGASALSILTEKEYFQGDMEYIDRAYQALSKHGTPIPILRKDFIFDALQVQETIASNASALLLIVTIVPDANKLRALRELAEQNGIEAIVEVFDEKEITIARESGATLIQVNARNLETLEVDVPKALAILKKSPPKAHETWILASGVSTHEDLIHITEAGYHAVLIGTSLMKNKEPGNALQSLLIK